MRFLFNCQEPEYLPRNLFQDIELLGLSKSYYSTADPKFQYNFYGIFDPQSIDEAEQKFKSQSSKSVDGRA